MLIMGSNKILVCSSKAMLRLYFFLMVFSNGSDKAQRLFLEHEKGLNSHSWFNYNWEEIREKKKDEVYDPMIC